MRALVEAIAKGQPDDGEMTRTTLRSLADKVNELVRLVPEGQPLDDWQESAIIRAENEISGVYDYFKFGTAARLPVVRPLPSVGRDRDR